jgi:hypothetical protein
MATKRHTAKKTKKLEWRKVTPLSKGIALAIFILFPFVGFWLGMVFQKSLLPLQCLAR